MKPRFRIRRWKRNGWLCGVVVDMHSERSHFVGASRQSAKREEKIDATIAHILEKEKLDRICDEAIRQAERRDDYIYNNTHTREEAEWEVR